MDTLLAYTLVWLIGVAAVGCQNFDSYYGGQAYPGAEARNMPWLANNNLGYPTQSERPGLRYGEDPALLGQQNVGGVQGDYGNIYRNPGDPYGRFNRTRIWQNLPGLPGGVQALMPGSKEYIAYRRYLAANGLPFNPMNNQPNMIQPYEYTTRFYDQNLLQGQGPFASALQGPPRFDFLRSGSVCTSQVFPLLLLLSSLLSLL